MINTDDNDSFFSAHTAQSSDNKQETKKTLEAQEMVHFQKSWVLFLAPMSGDS